MSNNVLFVQWGNAIPGREQKSLEVFMNAQEFFFNLKNQGSIESCDFIGFETGNTTQLLGCLVVRGTPTQIENVRQTDKFRELTTKSSDLVQNFSTSYGVTGDALRTRINEVVNWRKQLGIG
jgi:hypothetical protein